MRAFSICAPRCARWFIMWHVNNAAPQHLSLRAVAHLGVLIGLYQANSLKCSGSGGVVKKKIVKKNDYARRGRGMASAWRIKTNIARDLINIARAVRASYHDAHNLRASEKRRRINISNARILHRGIISNKHHRAHHHHLISAVARAQNIAARHHAASKIKRWLSSASRIWFAHKKKTK